jgi:hypothetical protein
MKGVVAGLAVLLVLGLFFFRYAGETPSPNEMTRTDTAGAVVHHYADWGEVWVREEGRRKILVAKESIEVID